MKKVRQPLVIGNWKMHPTSLVLATKLARELKKKFGQRHDATVVVAPPFVYIESVRALLGSGKSVILGAQDAFPANDGSYTSQISIPMLQDLGVRYVILGHSERRALGETDAEINKKLTATIKAGLVGVLCVGEQARDAGGHYLSFIEEQVRHALKGISKSKLEAITIAYEPLWAIGTGTNATPADVHEIKLFIERILTDMYGRTNAQRVRILYGGSVNSKNAQELYSEGAVDGFLVGGASLKAEEFVSIVHRITHS
jgi:triosephosphate isomerase